MRLRAMPLPNEQFILILDRCPEETIGKVDWNGIGEHATERLDGCGGIIVFTSELELP